jgi:hypothetical protein
VRAFGTAVTLLMAWQGAALSGQTLWQEQRVEAAFLYNFAKFVEWPGDSGVSGSAPLTFCLMGAGPFQRAVEESLAGKTINGHLLVVRRIDGPEEAPSCQVAFIGWDEKKRLPEVLDALNGAAVLTVADFEQFASRGGMIQLIKEANKFRFAVNVDAVHRHGLRVSSRLLQLAEVVRDSGAAKVKP